MANVSVLLEEDSQIIVQRIEGNLTVEMFEQLYRLTDDYVTRLKNPADIRILVDARRLERTSLATRKRGIAIFDEQGISRMAFFGGSRLSRVMQRIVMIVVGEKRVGMFATEQEAREWLLR